MKEVNYLYFAGCEDINRWYEGHQDCQIINIETQRNTDFYNKVDYRVWFIETI